MAKMKLAESTFTLIPEGTTTFKVMEVNDEKYEDYGKLESAPMLEGKKMIVMITPKK